MLYDVLLYGAETYGTAVAKKFLQNITHYNGLLQEFPELGKIEPRPVNQRRQFRSILVHKKYKMIYYISENRVNVIALWNCQRSNRAFVRFISEHE